MSLLNTVDAFRREGARFVNVNPTPDTGVALTGATTTAWVATTPSIIIVNNDVTLWNGAAATGTGNKRIEVDFIRFRATAAGTALTALEVAVLIDGTNRFSSGGTDVSANSASTNMKDAFNSPPAASIAKVYTLPTATAASANVRTVGRAILRTQIPVLNDQYYLDFGYVDGLTGSTSSTTAIIEKYPMTPAIIWPGQSMLVYLWGPAMSAAPTFEYDISWIEV